MSENRRREVPLRTARYEDGFRVMQGKREYVTYLEDSSFRMWYSDIPWRYDSHVHSAVEVVLTLEGSVDYVVDGQEYTVRKGEILLIRATPKALKPEQFLKDYEKLNK